MRSNRLLRQSIILTMILLLAACGRSGTHGISADGQNQDTSDLNLIQVGATSVELPALVTVSFKVESRNGNPVPDLTLADNFTFREQGQSVDSNESHAQIIPDPTDFSYHTLLLLDLSGSILGSNFDQLKTAANAFIQSVNVSDNNQVKLAFFDGTETITDITGYSSSQTDLIDAIDALDSSVSSDSSTNLNGAVQQGVLDISNEVSASTVSVSAGSLVIFTDGVDQAGRTSEVTAQNAVDDAIPAISIFTIGLGQAISIDTLENFGRDGFENADNIDDLVTVFGDIASKIIDEANSFYILKYCSPRRSGQNNELVIEAVLNGRQGSLSTNFDADSFTGGCSL